MDLERGNRAVTQILVCSYLEPEYVERIRAFDPRIAVEFRPDLLPAPRFAADHIGAPFERSASQQAEWEDLMRRSDVLFDFDHVDPRGICRYGASVRWVQATSAGIGDYVQRFQLHDLDATFTTASGVHARPLAEFVLWAMLAFAKRYPVARAQQRAHVWQRFSAEEVQGKTLAIVGLGSIGKEVARLAGLLGVRVVGTKRDTISCDPASLNVERVYPNGQLREMVATADFVCLAAPNTPETAGMVDREVIAAMKQESVLINIGRGSLVDEAVLIEALRERRLAGAVLDVAAREPLPEDHPFWSMENVIVFPHSASTSNRENERITSLFLDNLERYLGDRPLRNVFQAERAY